MSSIYQGGVNSENIAILLSTIICDSKKCWFGHGIETEFENRVGLLTSQMSSTDDLIPMFTETYFADWYLAACKKFPFITSDGSSIIPIDDCSNEAVTLLGLCSQVEFYIQYFRLHIIGMLLLWKYSMKISGMGTRMVW